MSQINVITYFISTQEEFNKLSISFTFLSYYQYLYRLLLNLLIYLEEQKNKKGKHMDTYRLTPNTNDIKYISRENFEKDTKKLPPYYQPNKEGQYAVCPVCGNPIIIIGLYNSTANRKPYGKHYPISIEKLAKYNKNKYKGCPLASNTWKDTEKIIKEKVDEDAKEVFEFIKTNFDSIIRLLREITGIIFTDTIIQKMIQHFLSARGYCYQKANTANSAWVFGYIQNRVNFFGSFIDKNHPIYNALIPHIKLENNKVGRSDNFYIPEFYFMSHRTQKNQNIKAEYIDYYIDINNKNIFKQEIKIELPLFSKIINRQTEKTKKDIQYIEMFNDTCNNFHNL